MVGDRFGLVGTMLAGRYRIEHPVAEGGFAVVYRAFQVALDRPVALKVLKTPAGLDDSAKARFRERFAAEARTIARLKHPFIVDVHDYGVLETASGELAPWMTLEWLEGETLEIDLARRRGAGGRNVGETLSLLRPVVEALAYAHKRGVVHRDIKPANIMIVEGDGGPLLRMLDFGIAKIVRADQGDTHGGGTSGGGSGFSPDYAAPEQVTLSRTGTFTDVHAAGLLLTEMLTDEPPFSDGEEAHLFEQVMSSTRPTPRTKGVDAGRLEKVILRALALSPRHRFKNAGELLEAIDAVTMTARPKRRAAARTPAPLAERPPLAVVSSARRRAWASPALAVSGGLVAVAAFVVLAWTLSTGLSRSGSFPSEELAAARAARAVHAGQGRRLAPTPPATAAWIVPICPAPSAAPSAPAPRHLRTAGAPLAGAPARQGRTVPSPPRAGSHDETCSITINSVPWSEVWVDGRNTGRHTPFVDYEIPCGGHEVAFKRPDLQIDETRSVFVTSGETFKRRYTLTGAIH